MSIDPRAARVRISAGVDWAKDDHAICVVGGEGEVLGRFAVRHDAAGLKSMVIQLLGAGVGQVGIERPDGPVVTVPPLAAAAALAVGLGVLKRVAEPRRAAQSGPALTQSARDALDAARQTLAASVAATNPLSQRALITRFGISRDDARDLWTELVAGPDASGSASDD